MERPVEPRLFIPNIFNIYSENLDKIKEENMNKYKAYMERRDFEIARDKWILLELLEEAKSSFVNKVCEEEIQSAADVNALFGKPHKFIVITLQETLNREKNVCVEKAGEAFKACEFLKDLVRNECIGTVNPWTGKVANSSFITEEMLDRFTEWLDCEEEVQTQPPIELSLLMPRVYAIDVNKKYLYELLKEARNVYVSFECGSKREYIEQLYAKIRKNNPQ
jgi:hypothetical protein